MKSLLVLSIVFAAVAIPAIASRDPNPVRGARRMLLWLFVFNALYLLYISRLHPVLFVPKW